MGRLIREETVKDAAKRLPKEVRKPFLRAWKAAGCMDIYGGNLDNYISVIGQVLERKQNEVAHLRKAIEGVRKTLLEESSRIIH